MSTRPRGQFSKPSPPGGLADRGPPFLSAPEIRFRVDFDDHCSVGIGKIRLLEAIENAGSLSQAARDIGMSYRRAWLLIDSMNAEFDTPVMSATVGGSHGGGAKLTSFGRELIKAYRKLETRLTSLTANYMGEIAGHSVGHRGRSGRRGISLRKTIAKPLKRTRSR